MDDAARKIVRSLIQDELSAVETYRQALGAVPSGAEAELRRLQEQHSLAAALLRGGDYLQGEPLPDSSGVWGAWKRAIEGTASLLGPKAAIRALRDAEKAALDDYEGALREEALPTGLRQLIASRLLPEARGRLPALDGLLGGRKGAADYHSNQGYGPAGAGRAE